MIGIASWGLAEVPFIRRRAFNVLDLGLGSLADFLIVWFWSVYSMLRYDPPLSAFCQSISANVAFLTPRCRSCQSSPSR